MSEPILTVPDPPTNVRAVKSLNQPIISVYFTPSANNGGSPITSYTVTSDPPGFTATTDFSEFAGTITADYYTGQTYIEPLKLTGFTERIPYTFTVVATNSVGSSEPSVPDSTSVGTPYIPIAAPENLEVTPGDRLLNFTFDAPSNANSYSLPEIYYANIYTDESSSESLANIIVYPSFINSFTNLTNDVAYYIRVFGRKNLHGDSSTTNATGTPYKPLPPSITATVDTNTIINSFIVTAIPSIGAKIEPVTGYTMTVTPEFSDLQPITYTGPDSTHSFSGVYSGIDYTITVVAHSNIGDSNTVTLSNVRFAAADPLVWSIPHVPAPCDYPTPPFAKPGPGYGEITVSFYTSLSDTVDRYEISPNPLFSNGPIYNSSRGELIEKIFSGLMIEEEYTFRVYSKNEVGTGNIGSITTSPVKPLNVIPPVITTPLTVGDGMLNVSFIPQVQDLTITPTHYTIALSASSPNAVIPASQTVEVAQAPIGISHTNNFSGLTNGVIYTATVTINATSNSVAVSSSSTETGTPNGQLPAPTITSVDTSVNTQLTVNYNQLPGAVMYSAQAYLNGVAVDSPVTGTSTYLIIPNLNNGALYTIKVKAKDTYNVFGAEATSTATMVSGTPTECTGNVTNIGSTTANVLINSIPTLKYGLVVFNGGVNYVVQQVNNTINSSIQATSSSLTIPITGLSPNTQYAVVVITRNNAGSDNVSYFAGTFTTLNVVPPTGLTVTSGNGSLTVNFTPSTEPNQTNHVVEILNGATVVGTQTFINPTSPQSVTFNAANTNPDLINGVLYTAKVTVNAAAGSSPVTSTGTPNGPPAPPTNVSIASTALDNQLVVNYILSASGTSYVTSYDIILTPSGGSPLPAINVLNTTTQVFINPTTQPDIKIIAGKPYSVIVRANSANGSTDSASASGTPLGDAEPVTITSVDADNKKITVNFNASATPSEHLESYIVVLTPLGGSDLVSDPIPVTSASTYSYTFEGLTNYVEHTAKVITKGNANLVKSTEINSNTLKASTTGPDAPTNVRADPDQGKAFVYFEPPVVPVGGSLIEEYTATSSPGGFTASGSASPLLVEGLSNGTEYTFTVVAKNNLEKVSVASEPSLGVTPTSVPDAPTLMSAVAGDGKVTITFTTPFDGGSEIRGYSVFSVDNGGFERSKPAPSSPFVYEGLENGQKYTFSVCANNDKGSSESSNSLKATPASLAILDILNINARVIPDVSIFMNSMDALDIAERGDVIKFAELGVDFSALITVDHKKKITKKLANLLFQEKSHLKHFKIKKSLFPIVSSNAKDDIIVIKANGEPFEIEKLDSTTSIYVGIEKLGDYNTFIIGSDEFTIRKTATGYDFTYDNTTTSFIDGAETRVNDLLIVFGGGSISFDPFNQALPCYARGTLIGTSRGWVPIENLLISDKLRTYDRIEENMFKPVHGSPFKTLVRVKDTRYKNKFGDIKFIGKFTVDMMHENTAPIRITAGSLGPSKPEIDLLVSPNHSMLIGNRLIFAKFLVNGSTIYQDMSFKKIEYFHILSDNHYIINANGALSETLGSEELGLFHSLHSCSDNIENIDIKDNDMLAY